MPTARFTVIFAVFALLVARAAGGPARAADHLSADEVLAASAAHFPRIVESLAKVRGAEADALAAQGAFDIVFSGTARDRATGFWTGRFVNVEAKRNLRPLGASVFGGYRLSEGTFPIYEDIEFTNTGGEFKVGAIFSLLRNRQFDDRRFATRDAALALSEADLGLLLTRVGVQHRAIGAYWRWVASGRQLAVYEELLKIANRREAGLEEQVRRGARAAITVTENKQNILRRERLVMEARREFLTATNDLSLYYRDERGAPVTPASTLLPPAGAVRPLADDAAGATPVDGDERALGEALRRRPELSLLRTALARAEGRIDLAANELNPQLDFSAEVSHDVGNVAEGGISRDSTDTIVALRFSQPLQRRAARGKLAAAEAEREALAARRRQTADEIEIELRNIVIGLNVSRQLAVIAENEVEQTEIMEGAERRRFASGASDFFLVNVREETTADARIRYLLADLETRLAEAAYAAATVDLGRLGLEEAGL
ncbi:MAG: TolC family protein [Parvularculaceae bacterium]